MEAFQILIGVRSCCGWHGSELTLLNRRFVLHHPLHSQQCTCVNLLGAKEPPRIGLSVLTTHLFNLGFYVRFTNG